MLGLWGQRDISKHSAYSISGAMRSPLERHLLEQGWHSIDIQAHRTTTIIRHGIDPLPHLLSTII
jgi:hypothetical protein